MDADRANRWLTLVANISVVAGIIFLAIEVRQNTENARASAYQSRSIAASEWWSAFASSPEIIGAWVAFENAGGMNCPSDALAAMSREDYLHLRSSLLANLVLLANDVYQYQIGNLDASLYNDIVAVRLKALIPLFDALEFSYPGAMAEETERLRQQIVKVETKC